MLPKPRSAKAHEAAHETVPILTAHNLKRGTKAERFNEKSKMVNICIDKKKEEMNLTWFEILFPKIPRYLTIRENARKHS